VYCVTADEYCGIFQSARICDCLEGYAGENCDKCVAGLRNFPECEKCQCNIHGTVPSESCEKHCVCKVIILSIIDTG